ncbi:MAG: dihydroorotate dehydrogenase electron transfer subunit [Gemmatimonadota bacterium]|nr:dihydroorotate dehydrogenase electron transfer subunit [Gemmatimonadota bacterium]
MIDEQARLLSNREVAADFYLARLNAPYIAARIEPGQFVNIQVGAGIDPLLRIPLSVSGVYREAGVIEVLYEEVGPKTRALSQFGPDAILPTLGPLGKWFAPPPESTRVVLVGGGIGVPPLLYWGLKLRQRSYQTALLVGARTVDKHLPSELLAPAADAVRLATDDGSLGHAGLVTDLLQHELVEKGSCAVYCCGPHAMMEAVAAICLEAEVPCQVSLEEYMACGIGICVGCAVELATAKGDTDYGRYARVCVDGPAFDARQIKWASAWPT